MKSTTLPERLAHLQDALLAGRISRRDLLRHAAALSLSGSAIATLLAACGNQNPTATAAPAGGGGSATATKPAAGGSPAAGASPPVGGNVPSGNLRLMGFSSSPEEDRLLNTVLDDFMKKYPSIQVKFEPVAEYATKLQTDLASGSVADVFYVDSMLAPDLMKRGLLLELDSYIQRDKVDLGDFYPPLLKAFQYKGKTYGLPKDWSSLGMEYNTDFATAAGIDKPPATWDELKVAVQKMTQDKQRFGAAITPDLARWLAFVYAAGGRIVNDDATKMAINSPEALTALEFYYGLYKDGYATTPADTGTEWPGDTLVKQKAALVFEGNWLFPFIQKNAPNLKYTIAEMPAGPKGRASLAYTVSYSAYKNAPNKDAAWFLINYLTGPEGMKKWTSLGLAMPARKSLEADWANQFKDRAPFLKAAAYAQPWQIGPGGQEIYDKVTTPELKDVFAGKTAPKDALANMEKKGNDILARQ